MVPDYRLVGLGEGDLSHWLQVPGTPQSEETTHTHTQHSFSQFV